MQRTCSAAVLAILGALALVTLLASPAGADDTEELAPFGRCDVYRPADGVAVTGVDRCTTGMVLASGPVEPPVPTCADVVSIPSDGGEEFYIGGCPEQTDTTTAAATAEPAPAPATRPPPSPAPAAPTHRAAPTTTASTTSTTSTTFAVPPQPEPSGGASSIRPATAEVVSDPAASSALSSAGRAATIERDHSPLVMLFVLALLAVVLLGISRMRSERD